VHVGYLDHAATTPLRPEAREAMLPWLGERFGNPSGSHRLAQEARQAIEEARDTVASVVGCEPREVVFTGGGTESDNLALHGRRAICSPVEHHAVLHGAAPTVPLDGGNLVVGDAEVVSVMLANNEVGSILPLGDIASQAHEQGALVHTDAVQAFTWLDVRGVPADLVSFSAHKLGGPQGVGVLVARAPVNPLLHGGGQEQERRSGTHNVAGIVGMAAAMAAADATRAGTVERVGTLRDRLADGLLASVPGCHESGDRPSKVAGICSLLFEGIESEALLFLLDEAGVCATAASSCASGALEPSHVLAAMGVPRDLARGSLRLSLGWCSTDADVDLALDVVPAAVARLRQRPGGGVPQ
jgi:cysteine desulfurase